MTIRIEYLPFPKECTGQVYGMTTYRNGEFLMVIDSSLSYDEQLSTLRHELLHIKLGHFSADDKRTVPEKEKEVEMYMAQIENGADT